MNYFLYLPLTRIFVVLVQRCDYLQNPIQISNTNLNTITSLKWKNRYWVSVFPLVASIILWQVTWGIRILPSNWETSLKYEWKPQPAPHRPWPCWWNAIKHIQIDASISLINDHLTRGEEVVIISVFVKLFCKHWNSLEPSQGYNETLSWIVCSFVSFICSANSVNRSSKAYEIILLRYF